MRNLVLGAGDVARYEWGSYVTHFHLAPFDKKVWPKILASTTQKTAWWKTSGEVRAHLAFLHEVVHYFQDVSTGVGHWDFVARERHLPALLGSAKFVSLMRLTNEEFQGAELQDAVGPKKASLDQDLVFLPRTGLPVQRLERLQKDLAAANHGSSLSLEGQQNFSVESILEGEAVSTVALEILETRQTAEQSELLSDNEGLLLPDASDNRYQGALGEIFGVLNHITGGDPLEGDQLAAWLAIAYSIVVFLLDLSLAHPSAEHLTARAEDRSEYEPGLRLMRLLQALGGMSGSAFGDFMTALNAGDCFQAEQDLLKTCDYPYPLSVEVYKNWAEYWEQRSAKSDNGLVDLRRRASKGRSDGTNAAAWAYKFATTFLTHRLISPPVSTPNETFYPWSNEEFLDAQKYYTRLMDAQVDLSAWRIVELCLDGVPFVCPRARVCDASQPVCSSGINKLHAFPDTPGCSVRHFVEIRGFMKIGD